MSVVQGLREIMLVKVKEVLDSPQFWNEVFESESNSKKNTKDEEYQKKEVEIVESEEVESNNVSNNDSISISLSQI